MDHQELKCCVCDHQYSDKALPRNLECGHSFCSSCLDTLIPRNKKCPECRTPFDGINATSELPINYSLLSFSKLATFYRKDSEEVKPEPPYDKPSQVCVKMHEGKCQNHGGNLKFFMCLRCLVPICRECVITDHKDPPFGKCFVLYIDEGLAKIKKSFGRVIEIYISEARDIRCQLLKVLKDIDLILGTLDKISHERLFKISTSNIRMLKEKVGRSLLEGEKAIDVLLDFSNKIKEASSTKQVSDMIEDSIPCFSVFESYKMRNIERNFTRDISNYIKGDKDFRQILECCESAYNIPDDEGLSRWAPVTFRNQNLHIHSLRDGTHPKYGVGLPFDLLRRLVQTESQVVFFEVGWAGEVKGQFYVRLFGDTPRSRQTLYLCTGEKGPSYRNTCFYDFTNYENGCQILSGGDYERNDGSGGAAIVDGIISGGPYLHEVKAGLFVSWPSYEHWHLGTFEIYLKDTPGIYDYSAHGMVEKGLHLLEEASNIDPIQEVSVIDCGFVLPL